MKLNKETVMIPEAHISVFQTEDTASDQMLNFSLSGITCEDKFNETKVDELDATTNTHSHGDEALLPIPSQNWSFFESFINENKEEFLDLCTVNDFSTNLIGEENSDSFLFDESTLNSDVCSLKIRYESFQDNIKEKTHAHQDDVQLQFFPTSCCNGTKKEETPLLKNVASLQEKRREDDNPEHRSLSELESKKCPRPGIFMDHCKDTESSVDSVFLSPILCEDQGNWRKSADRYSNQTNYTLRAKRQIRYSDDYLYDIDSLETMKTFGKMDHFPNTPTEEDDDWCPRKRRKSGKKGPPVIIKYIIVNRFKGHKNMHVKIGRLDCTERHVLLTDEIVKKYKKLSPLKEFWSPVHNCKVYHNQGKTDGKLKICSDAGMSYMFFSSKNKKQRTLANGATSIKIGHSLNHQKDNVIETVDANTKLPEKMQKYDKSVYEFTDEIELKRITIRTVSKAGRVREMQKEDSFQNNLKKQNILSEKRRENAQDSKYLSDGNYLKHTEKDTQIRNANVHKIQGEWNSACSSLGNFNATTLHSSISDKTETSGELLSLVPASSSDCCVPCVSNMHSAPEILGGYLRSLLGNDDSSVNENFQISSQNSSNGQQFNEYATENQFTLQQKQTDKSARCSGDESNILPLQFELNIQEACNAVTIKRVHQPGVEGKELFSSSNVDSANGKLKNQLNVNNVSHQNDMKMYHQNEISGNFTQEVSEETKKLFASKDTLCILDISNFTPGEIKPTLCSEFSKTCTPEMPSKVGKSDVNSLEQCSQNQFPKKPKLPNECSKQFQIHSELYSTNIQACCSKSEPTSVSFSCIQSSNQLQAFDHGCSNNYKYSKVNKAINCFRKRHAKSNAKQWDIRTIQKLNNCNTEIKAIKMKNIDRNGMSPEIHKVVKGEEYSSDKIFTNYKSQPHQACKPTKGFTNKDLEMCTKLVKRGFMSAQSKHSIKEEKLNGKNKYWIAPAESHDYIPSNIPRGNRFVTSDQREFEEPSNILSNIVSGMAAVKQFMMASVEPILNQREVILPAVDEFMEVQNDSIWKPKPIQMLHVGTKDLKNKPLHISECTRENVGFDNSPISHVATCYVQSVFDSSTPISDCSYTSNVLCE
ncbi:neurite extension and migration factor-like isoform X2 [Narcine bancroftii]